MAVSDKRKAQMRAAYLRWREKNNDNIPEMNRQKWLRTRDVQKVKNKTYYDANKERLRAEALVRYYAKPELQRAKRLKAKYGLTMEQFDAMVKAQDGLCAICRQVPYHKSRNEWCVDHDHKTGNVRALLCYTCNSGIGHFKDSLPLFSAAMDYIRRFDSTFNYPLC